MNDTMFTPSEISFAQETLRRVPSQNLRYEGLDGELSIELVGNGWRASIVRDGTAYVSESYDFESAIIEAAELASETILERVSNIAKAQLFLIN